MGARSSMVAHGGRRTRLGGPVRVVRARRIRVRQMTACPRGHTMTRRVLLERVHAPMTCLPTLVFHVGDFPLAGVISHEKQ